MRRAVKVDASWLFGQELKEAGIPFVPEYKFHPVRKWRLDYYVASRLGVEIEGSVYTGGRHVQGKGFEDDCIKYASALLCGIPVVRFTTGQVRKGLAIQFVRQHLTGEAVFDTTMTAFHERRS